MKTGKIYSVLKLICLLLLLFCGLYSSVDAYDRTNPSKQLRYGFRYRFGNIITNTSNAEIGISNTSVSFTERGNYNGGANPDFDRTTEIVNRGYRLNVAETMQTSISTNYDINYIPSARLNDNIYIVYTTESYKNTGTKWVGPSTYTTYQPYTITWCGDGVVDNYLDISGVQISEECDPADPDQSSWLGRTCNSDCSFSDVPVECTGLTASPNSGISPLTSNFVCTGNNVTNYNIQVYDPSGNVLDTVFSDTGSYNFTSPGTYNVSCFVDGQSVTPDVCRQPVVVNGGGGGGGESINVVMRSGNPADSDGDNNLNDPTNDSQDVGPGADAIFRVIVTNDGDEDLDTINLTDTAGILSGCNGNLSGGMVGINPVNFSGLGDHNNDTLEEGEIFTYDCTVINTLVAYTNEITANGNSVIDGDLATFRDTSRVEIGAFPPQAIHVEIYSGTPAPADSDGDTSNTLANDSQTIMGGTQAIFNVIVSNIGIEDLDTVSLTDALAPNCAGSLSGGNVSANAVVFAGAGDHNNDILEQGENFTYSCNGPITVADYTNRITANSISTTSGLAAVDADDTYVVLDLNSPACNSLSVTPSAGTNSLNSTVVCTGNNVTTFDIDCGNGQTFNGAGTNSGIETFTSTCNYAAVGSYTPTCSVNSIPVVPACTSTALVTNGGGGGGGGGGSSACRSLDFLSGTGTGGIVEVDSTGRNITFAGNEMEVEVTCNTSRNYAFVYCGDNSITGATPIDDSDNSFLCKYDRTVEFYNPRCYVGSSTSNVTSTSLACGGRIAFGDGTCGDGVRQRPNNNGVNEQCDAGVNNGPSSMCTTACKIQARTIPNNGSIEFGPVGEITIGDGINPFFRNGEIPYMINHSEFDLDIGKLCVQRTVGASVSGPVSQCKNIGIIMPGDRLDFNNEFPVYSGNIAGIPVGDSFQDNVIVTTVESDGVVLTDAYFIAELEVRVSRPSIATTGGGTSFVKSGDSIANVNDVTEDEDDNFVGVSVGEDLSSSSKDLTDNASIGTVEGEGDIRDGLDDIIDSSGTNNGLSTDFANFDSFNGLSDVFIISDKDFEIINNIPQSSDPRTYVIENGDLIISSDITYPSNVAFIVRGGDIRIANNVEEIQGVYISIKIGTDGGNIAGDSDSTTQNILTINGSLYGDVNDLVSKRTFIEESGGQLNVGTIVSFGSSVFRKPAPLTGKFIGEYIESQKIAQ